MKLKSIAVVLVFLGMRLLGEAQDPVLPAANLGLANLMDGIAGPPGVLYQNYTQFYSTRHLRDASGHVAPSDLRINPLLSMHQLIWLTKVKVLGGNLGFTVLVPIVKLSATSRSAAGNATGSGNPGGVNPAAAAVPSVNPGVLGDLVQGTAIQWSGKKLFGKGLSHRVEFDVSLPVGAYDTAYAINPSAHLYTFSIYHAFTWSAAAHLNISARNQFNYNTHVLGAGARPGMFYNGNYSVEYGIVRSLWVELAGYWLLQLNQDAHYGDSHYYQTQYGIRDTREQSFALGGGLAYLAPGGILVEGKLFAETGGKNRTQGLRPTLRLAVPLSK